MKASSLILPSTLLSCANALQLHKRHNPSVVSVNFEKRTKHVLHSHEKRDGDAIVEIVFGVGIDSLENAHTKYPNLPYALADAGEINTPAFSLWLNNETHGEFLFGGVNKAKYTVPLVTYPVAGDNTFDLRDRALVVMTGFGTTSDGKTSELDFKARPVLLDSGTIQSRLSLNMTMHLIKTMKLQGNTGFHVGDLTLNIPLANFLAKTPVKSGVDGVEYCKIVYYEDSTSIILAGDFLRGAYVVYDWGNMEISLAQYNPEEAEDDIHEIVRDVPGASFMYLKFDQPAETQGTEIPTELPTVTATPLSTASGSGTGSAASSSTAAGDDEDNGATGSLPANLMYMMLLAFIFNIALLAQ
ncbi:aspartic-type endopeptidase OPSB [Fusarium pseudocircinatum]|uniref:Aspartic-type endopeptidase OPSB n=1 Tax=Fusarium pseudocircinatum TaxID=56676 RepID=A0A8H5PE73_9HYPO|nr:aspartic-type endopeptidase OPSB [Fusarium pseudocircinatum]